MVRAISVCVVKRESIRGFDLSKPLLLQTRRRKRPSRTASFKNRKEIDSKRKELADSMEGKEDKNDIGSIPEHPESSSANNYEDGVHDKQGQKLYESSDSRQIAQSHNYGRSLTAPESTSALILAQVPNNTTYWRNINVPAGVGLIFFAKILAEQKQLMIKLTGMNRWYITFAIHRNSGRIILPFP